MSSIVSQPPQRLIVLIYWKPYGRESGRVSCLLKGNSDRPTDEQMMIPRRMANVLRGKSDILKYTCPVPTRACSWDGKSKLVNTHTHLCTKSNWHVVSCSLIFRARVRNWENKKWKVLGKWLTNTISNRSVGKNDLPLQNHSSRRRKNHNYFPKEKLLSLAIPTVSIVVSTRDVACNEQQRYLRRRTPGKLKTVLHMDMDIISLRVATGNCFVTVSDM